jgi:hypothetical protein
MRIGRRRENVVNRRLTAFGLRLAPMLARLAFFVLLIAPPIALAADAPPGGDRIAVTAPAPKPAAATAPAPAATSPPAAPQDASACRMDCAQSYYACHAGDEPDACGGGWSQCVATCNTPNLAPPATPAP